MRPLSLNRVLERAVQYALFSGLVACGARSVNESDSNEPKATKSEAEDTATPADATAPIEPDNAPEPTPGATQAELPMPEGPAPEELMEPAFLPIECEEEPHPWLLSKMKFGKDYDYVAFRSSDLLGPAPIDAGLPAVVDSVYTGTLCAGASDVHACEQLAGSLLPTPASQWQDGLVAYGLVTTLADEVSLAESRAELLAVLGDIDTLDEAVLWAKIDGNGISCSSTVRQDGNDYEFRFQQLVSDCPISYSMNVLRVGRDGALETTSSTPIEDGRDICVGRRPAGHLDGGHMHTGHLVGDFFADVAQLERAAVTAFASLAEELAHFGAPLQLQERALQAREDEIRHANLTAQLARRHGGIPLSPAHVRPALKSLFTFALENMKEGCVRETHGAAVAEFQARRSRDPEVRRIFGAIAAEERRHAELSWAIHAWLSPQLDKPQLAQLDQQRRDAIAELRSELSHTVPEPLQEIAGLPDHRQALALVDSLNQELWAA